jgi:hypothetical protein
MDFRDSASPRVRIRGSAWAPPGPGGLRLGAERRSLRRGFADSSYQRCAVPSPVHRTRTASSARLSTTTASRSPAPRCLRGEVAISIDHGYDLRRARRSTEKLARRLLSSVSDEPRKRGLGCSPNSRTKRLRKGLDGRGKTVIAFEVMASRKAPCPGGRSSRSVRLFFWHQQRSNFVRNQSKVGRQEGYAIGFKSQIANRLHRLKSSRRRRVCARLTGISVCFLSSMRSW